MKKPYTKPLVILASARRSSDTEAFANFIFRESEIELINLLDYEIAHYSYTHNYPAEDGFLTLAAQLLQHELLVFATPVYWYAMSAHLKVFFDRLTDLTETHKTIGKALKGKKVAVLAIGTDPEVPAGFEIPFRLTAEYFGMQYVGFSYCERKDLDKSEVMEKTKAGFLNRLSL